MITKAPVDETVSQVTPPRQGQTTSTSPATRIERIVMNTTPKTKQQQQTPKMIVVTEAAEVKFIFILEALAIRISGLKRSTSACCRKSDFVRCPIVLRLGVTEFKSLSVAAGRRCTCLTNAVAICHIVITQPSLRCPEVVRDEICRKLGFYISNN